MMLYNYSIIKLLAFFIAISSFKLMADVINVPDDFETIQEAIDESEDGDTVLVQPGEYVENIEFPDRNIIVASLFLTEGEEEYIDSTMIDGNRSGSVVSFRRGEVRDAILIGFTITNGSGTTRQGGEIRDGGGIYISNFNPTISYCIIRDNSIIAERGGFGGGIACLENGRWPNGRPTISNCEIIDNSVVTRGGGIEAGTAYGGGISTVGNMTLSVNNCLISNNFVELDFDAGNCPSGGAGAYGNISFENCIITRNQVRGAGRLRNGGGVLGGSYIRNCTICFNSAPNGSGVYSYGSLITNTILNNSIYIEGGRQPNVTYSCVVGQRVEGEGNITENPQFVDAENDDFHLSEDSPCIDAGDPRLRDPDGTVRDMGALYYHQEIPLIEVSSDTLEFGDVIVENNSTLEFNISNRGIADLIISDISIEGEYFSTNFIREVALERDSSYQVIVTFSPEEGSHNGSLVISSNASNANEITVILKGIGLRGYRCFTMGSAQDVNIVGNYAYIADSSRGMCVIDISDFGNPELVRSKNTPGTALGVAVIDDYAYVADSESGLYVIDVSDPANLEEVGNYDTPGAALDVTVFGNYAYVADGENGLRIINVYDPERPAEVGFCETPGEARGVAVQGDFAYIADDIRGLRIINVSDPEEPEEVGSYNTEGWAWDVFVLCNVAYVADERYGLRIIDVSDPEHPSELGFYDTPENAYAVTVVGNHAYIADGEGGLCVVDVTDPEHPEEVDSYYTPDIAWDVFISGNYAYVADAESGLLILDVSDYTGVDAESSDPTPTEFNLFAAFPNPFNASTTISYGLPYPGNVSLQIYNTSGQQITTLFEGYRQPGIHTSILTADNLPSGLYFVRLKAFDKVFTRKIMLIR